MDCDLVFIEKIRHADEDRKIILTDFDKTFLKSLEKLIKYGKTTTKKQRRTLDLIFERISAW